MNRKLAFTSEAFCLAEVRKQARAFLEENGFPADGAELLVLAIDEACANVIRHAYANACKPVRLEMTALRGRVRFVLRDYGKRCEPSKIRSRALEDFRPGGLGVHIIQQAFDRVCYEPQARGTKLVLEKKLPTSREAQPSTQASRGSSQTTG